MEVKLIKKVDDKRYKFEVIIDDRKIIIGYNSKLDNIQPETGFVGEMNSRKEFESNLVYSNKDIILAKIKEQII